MSEVRLGRRAEQKRRWDNENGRDRCACGAMSWGTRCRRCADRERREGRLAKRREIQRRWLAGEPVAAIAAALRTSPGAIGVEMARMRAEGWELPHRRRRGTAASGDER